MASVDEAPALPVLQLGSYDGWKPGDFNAPYSMILQGYFQYLPAIEPVLPTIRQDLIQYLAPHREAMRAKYGIQHPQSFAFLHVRRGDYLKHPELHWTMELSYYRNAIVAVNAKRWLLLSDDVAWCREQELFTDFPMMQIADEPDELNGLALMSLCHGGAVIANSTYSWWGAMLGAEPAGSSVVYPSLWFSTEKPDLFPSHWIRL